MSQQLLLAVCHFCIDSSHCISLTIPILWESYGVLGLFFFKLNTKCLIYFFPNLSSQGSGYIVSLILKL